VLIASIILINLALIFYSVGVWAERFARYLKLWHVYYFWIGLFFDISGTVAMSLLSADSFDILKPHTLTGQIALWLMLIHAVWATRVVKGNNEKTRKNFHQYSIIVWIIWLIPYYGGIYLGMSRH